MHPKELNSIYNSKYGTGQKNNGMNFSLNNEIHYDRALRLFFPFTT